MRIKSLVIIAVLATAVLCSGAGQKVQAVTIDELIAQIAQLQAQLQALQAQQAPSPAWCYTFNTNLGIGITGRDFDVYSLRVALQKEGLLKSTQGGYDEEVASAVSAFQQKYASEILAPSGLKYPTGYVGPATRKKLNALYGCGVIPPSRQITINSVSGPTSLNVGQTGTWTVNATAPAGTTLTYSVNWGDMVYPTAAGGAANVTQTATFTHAYSQAGTYTVKFNVSGKSCGGFESDCVIYEDVQTSITVVVGGQISLTCDSLKSSQSYYFNVCSSNGFDNVCFNKNSGVYQGCTRNSYNDCTVYNENASQNILCPVAAQPSITVTSPNGSQAWVPGTTHNITWTLTGITNPNLNIDLYSNSGSGDVFVANIIDHNIDKVGFVDVSGNLYTWNIPATIAQGNYRLKITVNNPPYYGTGSTQLITTSAYFSINSSASPSITVTSPNGGESWAVGSTHNITWQSSGLSSQVVSIVLIGPTPPGGTAAYMHNITPPNPPVPIANGSYSWTVPSDIPLGSMYRIDISSGDVRDKSDNFFTIVAATTTAVYGACGTAVQTATSSAPATNLCSIGSTASAVSGSGPWTWNCAGSSSTAICQAIKVNGVCGTSNGTAVASAPATNLCLAGIVSAVSGSGPWTWNCAGSNGGLNGSCSATTSSAVALPAATSPTLNLTISPTSLSGAGATVVITSASGTTTATYSSVLTKILTVGSAFTVTAKTVAGYTSALTGTCNLTTPGAVAGQSYNCTVTYTSASSVTPHITSSTSAPLGGTIVITGTGFSSDSNSVYINNRQNSYYSSADGTTINFPLVGFEGILTPGSTYQLYVKTPTGSSNTVNVIISASPAATCSSFTYSAWGACTSGSQSRTKTTSSPSGCTGGTPVLTQSCTIAPTSLSTFNLNISPTGIPGAGANLTINIGSSATFSYTANATRNLTVGSAFTVTAKTVAGYTSALTGTCNLTTPGAVAGQSYNCTVTYTQTPVSSLTAINGACGTADYTNVSSAPTTNLCSTGTASAVIKSSASDYFSWSCLGSNGGTTDSCSADIMPAITSVTSVPLGGTIVITGTGFSATGNTVIINGKYNPYYSSTNNGTTINFPLSVATNITVAGAYPLFVQNSAGVSSNTVNVTITSATASSASLPAATCSSFTYSAWGTCTNSSQSRVVQTSSPVGCSGGMPVLAQSPCSATPNITSVTLTPLGGTIVITGTGFSATGNTVIINNTTYNTSGNYTSTNGTTISVPLNGSNAGLPSILLGAGTYTLKVLNSAKTASNTVNVTITASTTALNILQDALASIADAIARIAAQIQELMKQ